jgi:hypothetical protein
VGSASAEKVMLSWSTVDIHVYLTAQLINL